MPLLAIGGAWQLALSKHAATHGGVPGVLHASTFPDGAGAGADVLGPTCSTRRYTVLAQTKIFFTVAVLRMRNMLGKLKQQQLVGLGFLFGGAVLIALKDVATGVAASSGNRALGIAGLMCAQAVTSTANVAYEKRLREPGCDVWVRNVQLTAMISLWLVVSSALRAAVILATGGTPPSPRALFSAFCAPWVWLVVLLKAASAVLIALTISAGGNVLYAISKPWPVVFATLTTCVVLGKVPSVGFLSGFALSVAGIALYYAAIDSNR